MTDYTPTTSDIKNAWCALTATDGASFNRWLTAHNLKIAAEAWDAAVKAMRYEDGTPVELVSVVNPYRADRIEEQGGDDD